jgi:hypothetical protein
MSYYKLLLPRIRPLRQPGQILMCQACTNRRWAKCPQGLPSLSSLALHKQGRSTSSAVQKCMSQRTHIAAPKRQTASRLVEMNSDMNQTTRTALEQVAAYDAPTGETSAYMMMILARSDTSARGGFWDHHIENMEQTWCSQTTHDTNRCPRNKLPRWAHTRSLKGAFETNFTGIETNRRGRDTNNEKKQQSVNEQSSFNETRHEAQRRKSEKRKRLATDH